MRASEHSPTMSPKAQHPERAHASNAHPLLWLPTETLGRVCPQHSGSPYLSAQERAGNAVADSLACFACTIAHVAVGN